MRFLRSTNGEVVNIDPPDCCGGGGIHPDSINARGEVTGGYSDNSRNTYRGFLRLSDGSFIAFDAPGVEVITLDGTTPTNINSRGEITGHFLSSAGFYHGFLRYRDGTTATFAVGQGFTAPTSIDQRDEVVGSYGDGTGLDIHGFIRFADGSIATLDVPSSKGLNLTTPQSIDSCGEIAGTYYDPNLRTHGFIALPEHGDDHRQESDDHDCSDHDGRW